SAEFYNRRFGNNNWTPYQFIFNAIGQGDITLTPLQMANFTAAIANKGYFYTPHIVKEIEGKPNKNPQFTTPKKTLVDPKHFIPILEGMEQVFTNGTAAGFRSQHFTQAG